MVTVFPGVMVPLDGAATAADDAAVVDFTAFAELPVQPAKMAPVPTPAALIRKPRRLTPFPCLSNIFFPFPGWVRNLWDRTFGQLRSTFGPAPSLEQDGDHDDGALRDVLNLGLQVV